MDNPKFKVGDEVFYYRWKHLGMSYPTKIIGIVDKKWYHLNQRYIVDAKEYPIVVKEKDLVRRKDVSNK